MSEDEAQAQPDEQSAEAPKQFETVYHAFHGRTVRVQLFEPYLEHIDQSNGQATGTPLLVGRLAVMKGEQGGVHLMLGIEQEVEGKRRDHLITLHPSDVKHITHIEESLLQRA